MNEYETVEELEVLIADMHRSLNRMGRIGRESDHAQEARIDQLCAKIEELEARNEELVDDMGELRTVNAIHRRHGEIYRDKIRRLHDAHTTEQASATSSLPEMPVTFPPVYGMRSSNFERMTKGYCGTLSRHGKTIVIVLPFEHEIVAINAVEYITGHSEHTNHVTKEGE